MFVINYNWFMMEKINERVSVVVIYDKNQGKVRPTGVEWNGRLYKLSRWGYHHKVKRGDSLQHIFSVATESLAFRLRLDTETLVWYVEEVSDGFAN